MKQQISFDTYKNIFDQYAARYDRADGRVQLKIIHTDAVVNVMKRICAMRKLSEHTTSLALLCAQFHDIGRFEQLKQYDTFLDHVSINHALLSCQVLEENHILDSLPEEDKEMVLTAILNHNRMNIDDAVAEECLELCKLIRDADKCDIFRVFATDDMTDVIGVPDEVVAAETVSPAVLSAIRERRCADKLIRKTHLDYWIVFLGFFFDFNYPESMAIAREQGYYRVPFDRVTFEKPEAREQVNEILDIIDDYMEHFSEKKHPKMAGGFSVPAPTDRTVPAALREFFKEHRSMALAFSGGTDSAYLLYAACACGCDVRAYYVSTPFQPAFELTDARRLAEDFGAKMTVISYDVLENEVVRSNPADRCYYCKQAIFNGILKAAARDGYTEIMDGTNASDDAGDRPGMRALREMKVLSPLRLCGITKKALREYSRNADLFTWEKPAYACLATRIPSGISIDKDILAKVEHAETALSELGFADFRVRVFPDPAAVVSAGANDGFVAPAFVPVGADGNSSAPAAGSASRAWCARIQVTEDQLSLFMEKRADILSLLKPNFSGVMLDLNARAASV